MATMDNQYVSICHLFWIVYTSATVGYLGMFCAQLWWNPVSTIPHFLRLSCGYHDNISNAKSSKTKIALPQLQWDKKDCDIAFCFSSQKLSSLFLLTEQQIIVWAQARLDFLTLWVLISWNLTMTGAFSTVRVTHLFQCRKFDTLHNKLTDILVSKSQKCVFIASLFHLQFLLCLDF